jgi:hypothetical protein
MSSCPKRVAAKDDAKSRVWIAQIPQTRSDLIVIAIVAATKMWQPFGCQCNTNDRKINHRWQNKP